MVVVLVFGQLAATVVISVVMVAMMEVEMVILELFEQQE